MAYEVLDYIDDISLITLVKDRPVLWDDTNRRKGKKKDIAAAWDEVFDSLSTDFESRHNEQKTPFTKRDIKFKWSKRLRDCYYQRRITRSFTEPKFSLMDDFLSKVYEEKRKLSSPTVHPSKPKFIADPDADTQLNSSLQRRDGAGPQAVTPFAEYSEPARPDDGVNPPNVMDSDSTGGSDDEGFKDVKPQCSTTFTGEDDGQCNAKPQCSTTFTGEEDAQRNIRHGVKRSLEENEDENGDDTFFKLVKNSLTKNFNLSQIKRFRSEILQVLDSVSNETDSAEMEAINNEILKVLLSPKHFNKTKLEIYKKIIGCVEEAKKE